MYDSAFYWKFNTRSFVLMAKFTCFPLKIFKYKTTFSVYLAQCYQISYIIYKLRENIILLKIATKNNSLLVQRAMEIVFCKIIRELCA